MLALEGVRIVDFTWAMAGPYATRILGDYGAEVIRVEPRGGNDLGRRLNPFPNGEMGVNRSGYFNNLSRNKRSVTVDLRQPVGVELIRRLVRVSDVVIENFSAGVLERRGLGYQMLRELRPDVIVVSMAGLGQTGPWKDYISYGPILQALSGITYWTGYPDRPPVGVGYSYSDHVGGLTAALAVMHALRHRLRTGQGQYVDVSQFEGTAALLGPTLLDAEVNGRRVERVVNREPQRAAAPHGVYPCAGDDRWLAIAVFNDADWRRFVEAIGAPEWTADPRFAGALGRWQHQDALDEAVASWTRTRVAEEAMARLQAAGVAAGVVQTGRDLAERDAHLKARGFWPEVDHPEIGRYPVEGPTARLSATPAQIRTAAPLLGQDNEGVYRELLGVGEDEFVQLLIEEVI